MHWKYCSAERYCTPSMTNGRTRKLSSSWYALPSTKQGPPIADRKGGGEEGGQTNISGTENVAKNFSTQGSQLKKIQPRVLVVVGPPIGFTLLGPAVMRKAPKAHMRQGKVEGAPHHRTNQPLCDPQAGNPPPRKLSNPLLKFGFHWIG